MGVAAADQAMTLTQPRDGVQRRFLQVLARPVGPDGAPGKISSLLAIIHDADLAAAQRLSKRLSTPRDKLGRYFRSRFGPAGQVQVTGSLADHILARRTAAPPVPLRQCHPGQRNIMLRASDAAAPLIDALRMRVPAGSTERFRTIHRLFSRTDSTSALRLIARLRDPGDPLFKLFRGKLSSRGAAYLIDKVLAKSVRGQRVEELPENLDSERLRLLLYRGRVEDARTGKVLRRETRQLHDDVYREAAERGEAFTPASADRLADIALQAEYPRLPAATTRKVLAKAREHQGELVSGNWTRSDKVALSGFLLALKQMRHFADTDKQNFFDVLGVWARIMETNCPGKRGSYLDVWARALDNLGFGLERAYRDNLNSLGYTWLHAVHTPGFLEFCVDLHRQGELFKFKNFKAAARGGWDAVKLTAKDIVSLVDPDTYKQLYADWKEHGVDFFTSLDADTFRDFKAQLKRDFDAFARLPEDQQSRVASTILSMAVIDRKFPDIAKGTVNAAGKGKDIVKRKLDGPDAADAPIPPAKARYRTRTEQLAAGIATARRAGLPALIGRLKPGARAAYNRIGIRKPKSQGAYWFGFKDHADGFFNSQPEVVARLIEEVRIRRANKGIEIDDIRGNNNAAASVLVIDETGKVDRRVFSETNGSKGHSEETIAGQAEELRKQEPKKIIYVEAVFTERSACHLCIGVLRSFNKGIDGKAHNPALFYIQKYNDHAGHENSGRYGGKANAEGVRKGWLGSKAEAEKTR